MVEYINDDNFNQYLDNDITFTEIYFRSLKNYICSCFRKFK